MIYIYMNQLTKELHKPIIKKFKRVKVITYGISDIWGADLVDMVEWSGVNDGYKYMINIIDCFSRFVWSFPLKDKKGLTIEKILKKLFLKVKPFNLWVDKGGEFYNKDVLKLLKNSGVHIYSTYGEHKSAIVERFNRTLKTKMWKYFTRKGTRRWIDVLDDLVLEYNGTKHSTIGMKPNEVNKGNEDALWIKLYGDVEFLGVAKLKIGDKVRISRVKGIFEKGYIYNWSHEVFEIYKIRKTEPVLYYLKDYLGEEITGGFYIQELQKTKMDNLFLVEEVIKERVRRGEKEFYVKWLGFGSKSNSWIKEKDLEDV